MTLLLYKKLLAFQKTENNENVFKPEPNAIDCGEGKYSLLHHGLHTEKIENLEI